MLGPSKHTYSRIVSKVSSLQIKEALDANFAFPGELIRIGAVIQHRAVSPSFAVSHS